MTSHAPKDSMVVVVTLKSKMDGSSASGGGNSKSMYSTAQKEVTTVSRDENLVSRDETLVSREGWKTVSTAKQFYCSSQEKNKSVARSNDNKRASAYKRNNFSDVNFEMTSGVFFFPK